MSLKKILLILFILGFITALIFLYKNKDKQQAKSDDLEKAVIPISVSAEKLEDLLQDKEKIQYPAVVSAQQDVKIISKSSGTATQVNFEVGDKISLGDLLVKIEDSGTNSQTSKNGITNDQVSQAELAVEEAQKSLKLAKESYENLQDSSDEDLKVLKLKKEETDKNDNSNKSDKKSAKAQYESAKSKTDSQLKAAKNQIDLAELGYKNALLNLESLEQAHLITSPVNGTVTQKMVSQGETVSVGQVLGDLSNLGEAKIQFFVDANQLPFISLGYPIIVSNNSNETFNARVTTISPEADPITRRFLIEAKLSNTEELAKIGTVVSVSFEIAKKLDDANETILPLSSVTIGQNENYIFVLDGSHAKKVSIGIEKVEGENVAIKTDLPMDTEVITDGNKLVNDGDSVNIK